MKFEVYYEQPKKKGYAKYSATFYKIEDAFFWETHIKTNGAKNIIIVPK